MTIYEILHDGMFLTGTVSSPVDFISEIQPLVDEHGFDFASCNVLLYTDAGSFVHGCDGQASDYDIRQCCKICVLESTYSGLSMVDIFRLPVPQYCLGLMGLYVNAVRYIHSISETSDHGL